MEIAKGNLKISYNDKLEGLPFDKDMLSDNIGEASERLQAAVMSFIRTMINNLPTAQRLSFNMKVEALPKSEVMLQFSSNITFLLMRDGKPFLAKTDKLIKEEKGETDDRRQ